MMRTNALLLSLALGLLSGCSPHGSSSSHGHDNPTTVQTRPPTPTPTPTPVPGPTQTPTPVPGSFTRGQWTQYIKDNKSCGSALFVGNGTAPYDVFADGTTSVYGQTMQQAEGGSGGPNAQFS